MNLRYILYVCLFSFFMIVSFQDYSFSSQSYDVQDPQAIVEAYFNFLKNGDVASIMTIVGGKLLKEKKKYLKDKKYGTFLATYYKNAQLGPVQINYINKDKIECIVKIYRGPDISIFNLILSRFNNSWQITDDILH